MNRAIVLLLLFAFLPQAASEAAERVFRVASLARDEGSQITRRTLPEYGRAWTATARSGTRIAAAFKPEKNFFQNVFLAGTGTMGASGIDVTFVMAALPL